jgi:hypothetical protein
MEPYRQALALCYPAFAPSAKGVVSVAAEVTPESEGVLMSVSARDDIPVSSPSLHYPEVVYQKEYDRLLALRGTLSVELGDVEVKLAALATLLGLNSPDPAPKRSISRLPSRLRRREELSDRSIQAALRSIAGWRKGETLHARDFSRLIYVIESDDDLRRAGYTMNTELIRSAAKGVLTRRGKNYFQC